MNANENHGKFVLDNLVLKFKCYITYYKEIQNYQDWNVFKANFGRSKINIKSTLVYARGYKVTKVSRNFQDIMFEYTGNFIICTS